jgi:hypothetical protein
MKFGVRGSRFGVHGSALKGKWGEWNGLAVAAGGSIAYPLKMIFEIPALLALQL